MTSFEFLFSLYGLLLGFSLVAVLGGLGRTLEAWVQPNDPAGSARGILSPLLGVFVMLDLLSFWNAAWFARDSLDVSGVMLSSVLLFASAYYLAAYLVFPGQAADYRNLDTHYFRIRRLVMGVLLVLLLVQLAFYASQPALSPALESTTSQVFTGLLILLMLLAMSVRGVRANIAILILLILRYLAVYLR